MIEIKTPTGQKKFTTTVEEAEAFCTKEALKEAKLSTGLYSTINGSETIRISANKKIWTIYVGRTT